MKTILMSSAVVLSMASLVAVAEETSTSFSWGNVTFQPRAYVGYADYELKSSSFNFVRNGEVFRTAPIGFFLTSPDYSEVDKIQFSGVLGGIGGTIASGPFYGDFYYQSTANEVANSSQEELITYPGNGYSYGYDYTSYGDGNAKHADLALSLGYLITDRWSIFAGYKSGKTDWDQTNRRHHYFNDGFVSEVFVDNKIYGDFKQDGPFLGTAYSLPVGPGIITFRCAYAYLDGTEKMEIDQVYHFTEVNINNTLNHNLDGNSNAFSLGVSWTQPITNNLGTSVGINYHRYKFNLSGGGQQAYSAGKPVDSPVEITGGSLTESLFTLTASLIYLF